MAPRARPPKKECARRTRGIRFGQPTCIVAANRSRRAFSPHGESRICSALFSKKKSRRESENKKFSNIAKLPKNYNVEFEIKPHGKVGGWSNILHLTNDGHNNGKYGRRIPGIWFWPNKLKVHVRDGDSSSHNAGCDPSQELQTNQWTKVRVEIRDRTTKVFYDNKEVCKRNVGANRRRAFTNVQAFSGDPWYQKPNATIKNLRVYDQNSELCKPPSPKYTKHAGKSCWGIWKRSWGRRAYEGPGNSTTPRSSQAHSERRTKTRKASRHVKNYATKTCGVRPLISSVRTNFATRTRVGMTAKRSHPMPKGCVYRAICW